MSFPAGDGEAIAGEGNPSALSVRVDPLPSLTLAGDDSADEAVHHLLFAHHLHPPPLMRAARNSIHRALDADSVLERDEMRRFA